MGKVLAQDILQQAHTLSLSQKYEECIKFISNQTNQDLELSLILVNSYKKLNEWELAFKSLIELKKVHPENPLILHSLLQTLLQLNNEKMLSQFYNNMTNTEKNFLNKHDPTLIYRYFHDFNLLQEAMDHFSKDKTIINPSHGMKHVYISMLLLKSFKLHDLNNLLISDIQDLSSTYLLLFIKMILRFIDRNLDHQHTKDFLLLLFTLQKIDTDLSCEVELAIASLYTFEDDISSAMNVLEMTTNTNPRVENFLKFLKAKKELPFPVEIKKGKDTYELHIMWSLHNQCNYNCSYCPDDLHSGDTSWMKLDDLINFADKVHSHYVVNLGIENILFSFTAGEPTLWKDFKPFVNYLFDKGFNIGLTTNASVNFSFWKDCAYKLNYICLSYHAESASNEKFLSVFEYLHNNPDVVTPSVRVMMHPSRKLWAKCVRLVDSIKRFSNWTIQCVHILDDYGNRPDKINYDIISAKEYLAEHSFISQFNNPQLNRTPDIDFRYVQTLSDGKSLPLDENKLINDNLASFYGWDCSIGIEQLFIHYNGDIQLAGCNVGGVIGNIKKYQEVTFPKSSITCYKQFCMCPTDIRISKKFNTSKL